jgi:hypothetical protein
MSKKDPVLVARRKVSRDIVKAVLDVLVDEGALAKNARDLLDTEAMAHYAEVWIPLTNAEAKAEYDEMVEQENRAREAEKKGPSPFTRLKMALGIDKTNPPISIIQTLEMAIEKVKELESIKETWGTK